MFFKLLYHDFTINAHKSDENIAPLLFQNAKTMLIGFLSTVHTVYYIVLAI
jgi:hypothetical protein